MSKSRKRIVKAQPSASPVSEAVELEEYKSASLQQELPGEMDNGAEADEIAPFLEQSVEFASPLTIRTLVNAITFEAMIYTLLFVVSVLLRVSNLDLKPLSEQEASIANAAWSFLQGRANGFVGSPFLFSSDLLLFYLFGASDFGARIVPAIVGSSVVLLPVLLRREIGRTGAVIASLLLLFSPSVAFFARQLSGTEVSAVAGFAAGVLVLRYLRSARRRDLFLATAATVVSLTAGAAAYTILLSGIAFLLLARWLAPNEKVSTSGTRSAFHYRSLEGDGQNGDRYTDISAVQRRTLPQGVILFVVLLLGISTAFFMNRAGVGAAFDLFGSWLMMFSKIGPVTAPINSILVYDPLALVFGLAALMILVGARRDGWREHDALFFLACSTVVSLLVYSIAGLKDPSDLVVVVIPMTMIAGWFLGGLFERAVEEFSQLGEWRSVLWGEAPLAAMTFIFSALVYLQIVSYFQQNRFSPGIESLYSMISPGAVGGSVLPGLVVIVGMAFFVGAVVVGLSWAALGGTRAINLTTFLLASLLFLGTVRTLWLLNFGENATSHELIAGRQTSLEARDLVSDLKWESEWRTQDWHELQIQADPVLGPIVQWYLRDFTHVQWTENSNPSPLSQALITTGEAGQPATGWISQRYAISMEWQPGPLAGADLWNWLLFRSGGLESWQYVRLWVPKPQ